MGDEPVQRMTGDEVQDARKALGLERADLARLLGNSAATIRDWERGKTFTPVSLAVEIAGVETLVKAATERAVERLVAELRGMPEPRIVVYAEGERPRAGDVAQFGVRWWRAVAKQAAAQVPGTRIGTRAQLNAMDRNREQRK